MPTASKKEWMSAEEYLAFEERSTVKHEYVDGRIFAMSGVILKHNVISTNIYSILRGHVKGSPCRAYVVDVKVHVAAANCFYYPDVFVACGVADEESTFSADPVLIVEVLSRSTANVDRREKVLAYRQIPSLCEYLIVHYKRKHVELHRKNERGQWSIFQFRNKEILELLSMPVGPLKVSLQLFYEDTELEHQTDLQVKEDSGKSFYDVEDEDADDDCDEDLDY